MIDHVQAEIAGEEEAYRFLTRVMRGDLKEPNGREVSVTDRLKACTGLMKRYETAPDAGAGGDDSGWIEKQVSELAAKGYSFITIDQLLKYPHAG